MADITVTGNQAYFNEDAKFFKDVYVYGNLFYDFPVGISSNQGVQGIQGTLGPQGIQGNSNFGSQGIQGTLGSQGFQGVQGVQGISNQGVQGIQGTSNQGVQGTVGAQGIQGQQSSSVDSYWVKNSSGIHTSSNVGIGTTNPQYLLQVQGNARITGAIYDSTNSPGVSGQVLQSIGTGIQWNNVGIISSSIFTSSGTWTKPSSGTFVFVEVWGGGGGGARSSVGNYAGGGGGGAYHSAVIPMAIIDPTVSVTVGLGGTGRINSEGNISGRNGSLSSFGGITAGGGGGGKWDNFVSELAQGGGGGGWRTNANNASPGAGYPDGIGSGSTTYLETTLWVGAAGGDDNTVGGSSVYGGAGGAGYKGSAGTLSGGTSTYGGNGGTFPGVNIIGGNGSSPGGGGSAGAGATSGSGARGEVRVYVW